MSSQTLNQHRMVTADMLPNLPETAQRYLNYTGVVGQPWINTVRVRYAGLFRMAGDKPWLPIKAEQFYTTGLTATCSTSSGTIASEPCSTRILL
jgi:hypothetical protein